MDDAQQFAGQLALDADSSRRKTFLRLFAEYRPALERLAAAYFADTRDREDLVQDIALALWQAIPRFRGEASERTWLYRIAHNTAVTHSVKLWRRGRSEARLEDLPETRASTDLPLEEHLRKAGALQWLTTEIRELPALDRQILTLHLEDLSHHEIGEIIGISEAAIATRLSRIRDRLAKLAGNEEQPMEFENQLRELYRSQPSRPTGKGPEDMLAIVEKQGRRFQRSIAMRNTLEYIACAVVTIVFAWLTAHAPYTLSRIGLAIVAASGVWIAYYLHRFGSVSTPPENDSDLGGYQRLLAESYRRQIRLLRNVKYWYLLPPYVGLMISAVANWIHLAPQQRGLFMIAALFVIPTIVFGLIWWANEGYGVGYLEGKQRELEALRHGVGGEGERS